MNASRNAWRTLHRAIVVAGLLLGTSAVATAPALAGGRGHDHRRGPRERVVVEHRGHGHRHGVRFERFVVPRVLRHRHARDYAAYRAGSAWYAPHRHAHRVYYFPVRLRGTWVYEPHFYCGRELFIDRGYRYRDRYGRDPVRGYLDVGCPRFRVRVGF